MKDFKIKEIVSSNIVAELQNIGFDPAYKCIASDKFRYKNFKIYDLNPAQANILKQLALSVGADCGTHHDVITGNIETSNVILGGSYSQLKKISEKLKQQPFSLKELSGKIYAQLLDQEKKTKLIGILNVTPDSFSDGGKYNDPINAQKHLMTLIEDGADMVDIGAESTKPYSKPVESHEQIERLKYVLKFIQNENIKIPISVDTRSSEVADFALNHGVNIINDVSGFEYDKKMPDIISKYGAGVVIQHSQGTPENMQNAPLYFDVVEEIYFWLKSKIDCAISCGINNIIVDPGIGFGKTKEHNYEIINRVEEFNSLEVPLMLGISRKSFLNIKDNNNEMKDILTAAISYQLINKIDYLRVHNVKLHKIIIQSGDK